MPYTKKTIGGYVNFVFETILKVSNPTSVKS